MTDQYVPRAALARWLTGIPLTKCRVTVKREPRDVVLNDKRNGTFGQKPSHFILHDTWDKIEAFLWIFTFKKTASRSFRYLSLSLQNGVLRNQGDTGTRALPTIKPCPITTQKGYLWPALITQLANHSVSRTLRARTQVYSSLSRCEDLQEGFQIPKGLKFVKLQDREENIK